jgi:hypothetical protein
MVEWNSGMTFDPLLLAKRQEALFRLRYLASKLYTASSGEKNGCVVLCGDSEEKH